MKILSTVGFGLLFSLIITSCSIEKRLYNKGYHIEWHERNKQTTTIENSAQELKEQSQEMEIKEIQPITSVNVEPENKHCEQSIELIIDFETDKIHESTENDQVIQKGYVLDEEETFITEKSNLESEEPKKDGLAITSLILGLLGISVVAIVLGLIQLDKINKNPDKYSGKGFSISGVLLGYFWIVFCSFFFLPMQVGLSVFMVTSLLFAIYGMIILIKNEKTEPLGILGTILGWLGFMAGTFLIFDY